MNKVSRPLTPWLLPISIRQKGTASSKVPLSHNTITLHLCRAIIHQKRGIAATHIRMILLEEAFEAALKSL